MNKSKSQKGITLIALIITIIVLLILAVVTIGAVQNDGIIQHAKNSRQEYELAQGNEETILGNYVEKLNENNPGQGDTPTDIPTDTPAPTSITITGSENRVEVRNTIQLGVVDENGQTVSSENIVWSSSNTTVATVNNGTVLGKSLVGGQEGTQYRKDITITATYKGDDSITATKIISVCALGCSQCFGFGYEVTVECPDCQVLYQTDDLLGVYYKTCLFCMDDNGDCGRSCDR